VAIITVWVTIVSAVIPWTIINRRRRDNHWLLVVDRRWRGLIVDRRRCCVHHRRGLDINLTRLASHGTTYDRSDHGAYRKTWAPSATAMS
jgi:hypothetical protein